AENRLSPELNLTYWGTGNPGPDWNGDGRAGLPRISGPGIAAVFTRSGHRVEAPLAFTRRDIIRVQKGANAILAARHAYQDLVLDHQRRVRGGVAAAIVDHLGIPQDPSRL